jgi:hypothetical protein
MRHLFYTSFFLFLTACICPDFEPPDAVEGLRPLYLPAESLDLISTQDPRTLSTPTDFSFYGDYLLAMEKYQGIYVLDNTDPTQPSALYFWDIPGIVSYTTQGEILYADNAIDLLVINMSDPSQIRVLTKLANIYDGSNTALFPENFIGFFECVDTTRGVVIGWETVELESPKCQR